MDEPQQFALLLRQHFWPLADIAANRRSCFAIAATFAAALKQSMNIRYPFMLCSASRFEPPGCFASERTYLSLTRKGAAPFESEPGGSGDDSQEQGPVGEGQNGG